MDPYVSGPLRIDPDETMSAPDPHLNGEPADPVAPRRADVDAKQAQLAGVIQAMGCEAALLLVPAHVAEATGRNLGRGQTEEEVAGQLGHRLLHHGAEPAAMSVTADGRGAKFRRAGFTSAAVGHTCTIQATAQRDGLYVTTSRTVSF